MVLGLRVGVRRMLVVAASYAMVSAVPSHMRPSFCCFRTCFVLQLESRLVTSAIAGSGCLMTRVFIHLLFLSLLVCLGLNVHLGRMMLILDFVLFEGCLACFVLALVGVV